MLSLNIVEEDKINKNNTVSTLKADDLTQEVLVKIEKDFSYVFQNLS